MYLTDHQFVDFYNGGGLFGFVLSVCLPRLSLPYVLDVEVVFLTQYSSLLNRFSLQKP